MCLHVLYDGLKIVVVVIKYNMSLIMQLVVPMDSCFAPRNVQKKLAGDKIRRHQTSSRYCTSSIFFCLRIIFFYAMDF